MWQWLRDLFTPAAVTYPPVDFPEQRDQVELIQACRDRFGPPPRELGGADAQACQLKLTPEVRAMFEQTNDPLLKILREQKCLHTRGTVVWGHLVQANNMLFDPNNAYTLPANLVYSLDPYFDGRITHLGAIARGLFAQKGSIPADRELREFIRVITDERERILRRELPRGYCGGHSVYFTTCFIQPAHLPANCLTGSAFPLLVNYEETDAVMLLPSHFWPYALVRQWTA